MITNRFRPFGYYPWVFIALAAGVLALAACQPIQDPSMASGGTVPPAETDATAEPAAEPSEVEAAMATISTRSLRVRALPNDDAEVVAGVEAGETYTVTGISTDGGWVRIDVDRAAEGAGWVAADFVTLEGDITNIETVALESEPADTEEGDTEEADTEEAGTEEAGTEEADTGEAGMGEGDDAASEPEPTAEPEEESAAEATPEPTEEPAEEAAAEDEAAEEPAATSEPTEEPAEESADESTADESTADESTADESAESLGTVTITTDLPLRVRSAPTTEEENKVGNVFDGDTYEVLEINEDGTWVRIAVPELELENGGWVSAEFVIFNDAE